MKVSVLSVLFGPSLGAVKLYEQTSHVLTRAGHEVELCLVDNGAHESDIAQIHSLPALNYQRSEQNLGFARAINRAALRATGELFLLLNPDVRGVVGVVEMIEQTARLPLVGAVAPQLVTSDGRQGASWGWFHNRWQRLVRRWKLGGKLAKGDGPVYAVDWLPATAMCVPRLVWEELGGMCEDYFMYFEDVDFCFRLAQRGYIRYFLSSVRLEHLGAASYDGVEHRRIVDYRRSRNLFLRSQGGLGSRLLVAGLEILGR